MKTKSKPVRRPKKSARAAHETITVIAMAASAGGLKALSVILGGLPADFPAAIAIVMHVAPNHKSLLAEILKSRTYLAVKQAHTGDVLSPSSVFIAPPNHHLSVAKGGRLKLSSSAAEKVNHARPSAEPLFVSVAAIYKKNAIAVVLTGGDGDGSFGVQIIKDKGGMVIAQDRSTSENFSMPETSIETGDVDFILPLDKIAPKLMELVERGVHAATGSTGDPPVPSGHWPDGRERTRALKTDARKSSDAFPVPSGGSPLGTGQWPVLPTDRVAATSEFGLKRPEGRAPARRTQSHSPVTSRFSAGTKAAMIQRRK